MEVKVSDLSYSLRLVTHSDLHFLQLVTCSNGHYFSVEALCAEERYNSRVVSGEKALVCGGLEICLRFIFWVQIHGIYWFPLSLILYFTSCALLPFLSYISIQICFIIMFSCDGCHATFNREGDLIQHLQKSRNVLCTVASRTLQEKLRPVWGGSIRPKPSLKRKRSDSESRLQEERLASDFEGDFFGNDYVDADFPFPEDDMPLEDSRSEDDGFNDVEIGAQN